MNREQTLIQALQFATAYVQKAVADGLMEDCAVPASVALKRLRAVLDGADQVFEEQDNGYRRSTVVEASTRLPPRDTHKPRLG